MHAVEGSTPALESSLCTSYRGSSCIRAPTSESNSSAIMGLLKSSSTASMMGMFLAAIILHLARCSLTDKCSYGLYGFPRSLLGKLHGNQRGFYTSATTEPVCKDINNQLLAVLAEDKFTKRESEGKTTRPVDSSWSPWMNCKRDIKSLELSM